MLQKIATPPHLNGWFAHDNQVMFYFHWICLCFTPDKLILVQMCLERIDRLFKIQWNYKTLVLYEPQQGHLWYNQWNGAVPRFSQSLHSITCNSIYLVRNILGKHLKAWNSQKKETPELIVRSHSYQLIKNIWTKALDISYPHSSQ